MSVHEEFHADVWINLACCYFMLGMYSEASECTEKAPKEKLTNRLLFHLAHKVATAPLGVCTVRTCIYLCVCVCYSLTMRSS